MKVIELKGANAPQVDAPVDKVAARISIEHEKTRRHMDVLIAQLIAEYRLGLERMAAIEQLLDSAIASSDARIRMRQ
jgi:hypothetical protein